VILCNEPTEHMAGYCCLGCSSRGHCHICQESLDPAGLRGVVIDDDEDDEDAEDD
jgi:hypothetical protein